MLLYYKITYHILRLPITYFNRIEGSIISTKVLIANRGEIASRIISTLRTLDIRSVAIYSPEDITWPFVYEADESYPLSASGQRAYCMQDEILSIARRCKATAIHPGYGFLAENASFAEHVIDAGFTWIGPSPRCISLMGNKIQARKVMTDAGVPIANGASGTTLDQALTHAHAIGYPIMLKASLGGGGKGMHYAYCADDLVQIWDSIMRTAQSLYNSCELFIEKYIPRARHIEVQIAGDGFSFVHFFERECSIQRHHQKVIEETPCTSISLDTKERIYDYAVQCARTISYDSIGTVEFLIDEQEHIYFLEMNTRLQVEHPVTELTTGEDLVALQINLAHHAPLSLKQDQIVQRGHAIECRILAESPHHNFAPSTGTVSDVHLPRDPFIRFDHNLQRTLTITPFFDSMLGKLIAYGTTRSYAQHRLLKALDTLSITGIDTNVDVLKQILQSDEFTTNSIHTQWLEPFTAALNTPPSTTSPHIALIAAALLNYQKPAHIDTRTNTDHWRCQ